MKARLVAAFLLLVACVASPVYARGSVPVVNLDNIAFTTSSGQTPTLIQVKQAITVAAATRDWQIQESKDGKLTATFAHGQHSVGVSIAYSQTDYSLDYVNSVDMNYAVVDGIPVIHPGYNKWVQNLNKAIRLELLKL